MKWTIVSKGDLGALRAEIEILKKQRFEADLAANIRFQGMQNLFKLERELLEDHMQIWRSNVQKEVDKESVNAVMQFESLKLALLQELSCLRDKVQRETRELHDQTVYTLREITQRAKDEQNALKTRLLGSLASLAPAGDIQRACAHEWPVDWILSETLKYESQQCPLCDLWRHRFSSFWCQHNPQDQEILRYSLANTPEVA